MTDTNCISKPKPFSPLAGDVLPLENGGTESDLSATGPGFLFQSSLGAAVTVVGSTVDATELSYLNGVTSSIQSQLDGKQTSITGAITTVTSADLTVSRALRSNSSGKVDVSPTTDTEIGYLSGVTSAVQTQLDAKLGLSGGTMTGAITLHGDPTTALHATPRQYIDARKYMLPVLCASKTNGTLATAYEAGDTIDGVVLAAGDRILIRNQSSSSENGIYVVNSSGAPTRASDADTYDKLIGAVVPVLSGTEHAGHAYNQTTILTSFNSQSWSQIWGTNLYTSDLATIDITGKIISVANGGIGDAQVASGAGIAVNKLAAQTASKVAVYDSSGFLAASTISSATLARRDVVTTLTDASTINIDWSLGEKFEVLITDNRTLTYSNFVAGQTIYLRVQQDGAGSRTLTWPGSHRGPGGAAPVLSTGANRSDWLMVQCRASTNFDVFVIGANLGSF